MSDPDHPADPTYAPGPAYPGPSGPYAPGPGQPGPYGSSAYGGAAAGGPSPYAGFPTGYPPPGAGGLYPQPLGKATTSMTLGIVGLAGIVLTLFCGITLLAGFCSPVAVVMALGARKEMRAQPGRYSNEGQATAGLITGIVGCVLGVLAIAGVVVFLVVVLNSSSS